MNRYESYKIVDLLWLKEIPSHWDCVFVKRLFYIHKDNSIKKNPVVLSLARNAVKIRNIYNNEGQLAADYSKYNSVKKGDLLLNPMDLYSGANCNVSYVEGVISPAYINLRKKQTLSERYFDYLFKLQYTSLAFQSVGKGVSIQNRWTLSNETLLNYKITLPPLSEQEQIAKYLDWKINEIDRLILVEKKKIEKIKLHYSGLNSSYFYSIEDKFKNRVKLKNIANLQNGISEGSDFFSKGTPFVNYSDVFNNDILATEFEGVANSNKNQQEIFSVKKGDIFITRTSETIEDAARVSLCMEDVKYAVFSGFLIRIRQYRKIFNSEFLLYYLKSQVVRDQIIKNLNIVTRVSISQNLIKNIVLREVPRDIQNKVAEDIKRNIEYEKKLISLKNNNIMCLQQLKQSLISEVVTGQIDVRNIEIPEYEKVIDTEESEFTEEII